MRTPPSNDWLLHTEGASDLAAVLRATTSRIRDASRRAMDSNDAFIGLRALVSREGSDQEYARLWQAVEAALAGEWSVLAGVLAHFGGRCAHFGITLADWHELTRRTLDVLCDELFDTLQDDPARLRGALKSLQRYHDESMLAFTEAYVATAQEQLIHSDTLLQLTSIAHVLVGVDGYFWKSNPAFLELYGIAPHELTTRRLASLFDPAERDRIVHEVYPQALREGRADYDAIHVRADGTKLPVHIEAVRIQASGSSSEVWAHSIVDLTERQQLERLRTQRAELEAENQRVRDASRIKSEFVANMSHELRTPLIAILCFSELLADGQVGPLAADQRELVDDIHRSGQHLLELINDMLDLSRIEAGKLELAPRPVDLEALTREGAQLAQAAARAAGVEVDTVVARTVTHAVLDPVRYKQVLYNFLSNAIKFSARGSRVVVRVTPEGVGWFCVRVEDSGIGIAPEHLPRLFTAFEQLDAGRAKRHAGTGLGLALVKRLVEAQRGRVGVESELGKGSTFFAVLPLRAEPA